MTVNVEIRGAKRFRRNVNNLPKFVRKRIKKMMNDTGNAVVKEARASIKRSSGNWEQYGNHWSSPPGTPPNDDTGELAASISKDEAAKIGKLDISVTASAAHGVMQEFGTRYIEARPFLRPAFRLYSPLLTKAAKKLLAEMPKELARD